MRLVAVAGSSALIAHSRPSIGRGLVDGIGCNRLATMFMEKLDVNFSMFCLKDLLPESHLRCWQTFVLACSVSLLC